MTVDKRIGLQNPDKNPSPKSQDLKQRTLFLGLKFQGKRDSKHSKGSKDVLLSKQSLHAVHLFDTGGGFVFKNGFHKIKDTVNFCDPNVHGSYCGSTGRPFLGYTAPAPF
ncbi:hypothetical protein PRUPE_6G032000 [Prunus persica]|uniref:Uncharacterized protein n=1 Tax=Prunus persica TaxID=3760 RepID=A0A251NJG7_PRUPE|nr:hypothetical protein PRUPE_6G032000 [Prunus persica]